MDYKAIVTDMDGTLLNGNGWVSDVNQRYIRKALDKGVKVILSTGRLYASAKYHSNVLGLKDFIISANGSLLTDEEGNHIYKENLPKLKVREVIEIANDMDIYCHFYTPECIYANKYSQKILELYEAKGEGYQMELVIFDDINGLFNYEDNLEPAKVLFKEQDMNKRDALMERLQELSDVDITSSWFDNVEVMNKGVSKGNALRVLLDELNIDKEQVIAIGDNKNDISMLKYSGLGIAMENGVDEIKEVADDITLSNEEDGFAKVIEKYIL